MGSQVFSVRLNSELSQQLKDWALIRDISPGEAIKKCVLAGIGKPLQMPDQVREPDRVVVEDDNAYASANSWMR